MGAKKIKVKDLAARYKVSPKLILAELKSEGIEGIKTASSVIPAEYLELVESHFEGLKNELKNSDETQGEESNAGDEVHIKSPIIVKQLATTIGKKPNEVISALISMNVLASINQSIDKQVAIELCNKFDINLVVDKRDKEDHQTQVVEEELQPEDDIIEDKPEDMISRPPVVTFLGHVDHGKTSLQDMMRETDVTAGEAGGITQHIGASTIVVNGKVITFIDTPGHEAFTSMRERGANTTDIAILVVAADDGFMPQTVEALKHARAANVPIIVAINKMDLPTADPDKVLLHMQQNNLMSEDWGGDIAAVRVSAETGKGVSDLIDRIILESEMLELKANPNRLARGIVLESQLEQGLGATANILVQTGTLKIGDAILCGENFGKVKSIIDIKGKRIKKAGPSTPVKLVGLSGVPETGALIIVCENEKEAKRVAGERAIKNRTASLDTGVESSIETLFGQIDATKRNDLKIVIKSDVKGSGEAIADSLSKLPSEKVSVDIIHQGVGAITENDVLLAASSNAILVGFHVRVNPGVNAIAKREKVELRLYSIIYELLEDVTDALMGKLEPDRSEISTGKATILKIFNITKGPNICGSYISEGSVKLGSHCRVLRDDELIYNGTVTSLRRFQDEVKEVKQGLECGIKLDNFKDFKEDDVLEIFKIELKKATL